MTHRRLSGVPIKSPGKAEPKALCRPCRARIFMGQKLCKPLWTVYRDLAWHRWCIPARKTKIFLAALWRRAPKTVFRITDMPDCHAPPEFTGWRAAGILANRLYLPFDRLSGWTKTYPYKSGRGVLRRCGRRFLRYAVQKMCHIKLVAF